MQHAIQHLDKHHSKSGLPQRARQLLVDMAADNPRATNWCYQCTQYTKKSDKFCARCGLEVGKYYNPPPPSPWRPQLWDNQWEEQREGQRPRPWRGRTPSPRGRNPSPRGRAKDGKGKEKSKGKPKGKAQSEAQPEASKVPHLESIPTPPVLPPLILPTSSTSSSQDSASSEAQAKLDALINSLVSAKETLPPAILQALGEHTTTHTMQESKVLHRAVSAKTTARRELAKIRTARATYLTSWDFYLTQLAGVLESQFKDQDAMLQKYQDAEDKWQQQLKEAAATLSKLSADKPGRDEAVEADEVDMETDTAMDGKIQECVKDVQARARQRREQLQLLLQGARAVDLTSGTVKRETSRTPRRGNRETAMVDGPEIHSISDSPPGKAQ